MITDGWNRIKEYMRRWNTYDDFLMAGNVRSSYGALPVTLSDVQEYLYDVDSCKLSETCIAEIVSLRNSY